MKHREHTYEVPVHRRGLRSYGYSWSIPEHLVIRIAARSARAARMKAQRLVRPSIFRTVIGRAVLVNGQ